MLVRHRVQAFAVAGYASHSNPAHEIDVKKIIQEETSFSVTCGHEVSEGLNYRVRAETAALNAGIIPYLESLFDRIRLSLKRRGISAPVMVVKSDGSLTGLQAAREKPIETILSGPAASVAGVRHLTKCTNAIVVDMGGTTTDTAVVEDGAVKICTKGAVVGGWETHVKALDMRTTGLGGDSLIVLEDRKLIIGPGRVAPVSWLAATQLKGGEALKWIERSLHYNESSSRSMEIVSLNSYNEQWQLDERDAKIVDALREGPCSLHELAHRTDWIAWQLLPLQGLEERHIIQRCSLTPTDVLHAAGRMNLWDSNAAKLLCRIYSRIKGVDTDTFLEEVLNETVRRLAVELLMKQIDESMDMEGIEDSRAAGALINNAMQGGTDHLSVNITIGRPVIGMGAPVHQFLPEAAKLLHTDAVISPDADVANAIGAITSSVHVHKQVRISVDETGSYFVKGLADAPVFKNLVKAEEYAVDRLKRIVADLARIAGTSQTKLEIISNDMVGTVSDGSGVFLERVIEARVIGQPDITRLAASD
jgi:N-methylhydantoinase A/oxoprolinase/acetone carboxylase beta subunit